jgi:2-aminobenzoate-CoA ligase
MTASEGNDLDGTFAHTAHLDTFAADHLPPREQWPDFRFELPELQYPERMNCGDALLDAQIRRGHGKRRAVGALVAGKPVFATYEQLLAQANRIANVLLNELGLVPGNRVLLRSPNNPMMAACWLAVMKAGLIAVPTMPLLRAKELRQIIVKARVAVALCDGALADEIVQCMNPASEHYASSLMRVVLFNAAAAGSEPTLEALAAAQPIVFANIDTARDDVCLLAFTSGTTGEPKATMHFHRDVMAMCDTFCRSARRPSSSNARHPSRCSRPSRQPARPSSLPRRPSIDRWRCCSTPACIGPRWAHWPSRSRPAKRWPTRPARRGKPRPGSR